jgi:hypothetical protein
MGRHFVMTWLRKALQMNAPRSMKARIVFLKAGTRQIMAIYREGTTHATAMRAASRSPLLSRVCRSVRLRLTVL